MNKKLDQTKKHASLESSRETVTVGQVQSIGRGERVRTSDSCVPNAVLYQAELHPD